MTTPQTLELPATYVLPRVESFNNGVNEKDLTQVLSAYHNATAPFEVKRQNDSYHWRYSTEGRTDTVQSGVLKLQFDFLPMTPETVCLYSKPTGDLTADYTRFASVTLKLANTGAQLEDGGLNCLFTNAFLPVVRSGIYAELIGWDIGGSGVSRPRTTRSSEVDFTPKKLGNMVSVLASKYMSTVIEV